MCRSTEEMFLSVGARIGYFQGDVKKLVDDISTLRPTLFIGAPCDSLHLSCLHDRQRQGRSSTREYLAPL